MKLICERFKSEISYIIGVGYYLADEALNNDELVEHTELTYDLWLKGLKSKEQIEDEELLEIVYWDKEKNTYIAQWHSVSKGIEYIPFV